MEAPVLTRDFGFSALLPGDYGLSQVFLAIIFAVVVAVVGGGLLVLYFSTKRSTEETKRYTRRRREWIYTLVFLTAVAVFASSTLGLLPTLTLIRVFGRMLR
jgi:hypothetical protein